MGMLELFMVAVGLSMDAFAVSVCKGLSMRRIQWGQAAVIALFFGAFQALMPLAGFSLGRSFAQLIEPIDHWVTFVLLAAIGGKMVWDGVRGDDGCEDCTAEERPRLNIGELVMLAVATSIDALAVGVGFAFLNVNIWLAVTMIGIVTFALSFVGVVLGNKVGTRYNRAASVAGGAVLILMGLKTLLEHLGVFAF